MFTTKKAKSLLIRFREVLLVKPRNNFSLLVFKLRKYSFGFESACNYLRLVDESCIPMILRSEGAIIGKGTKIQSGIYLHNCKNLKNLVIGKNCSLGKDIFLDLRDRIEIGDNVVVSMRCTFITHIDITPSALNEYHPPEEEQIKLDNDVYVGSNSVILMGVEIGHSSFIAASSLVNKSFSQGVMVAGVPAQEIRKIIL